MYPAPFSYHRPGSLHEAIGLLTELGETAKPLAGGQSLIPILKLRMDEPTDLVDIARLPGLHFLRNEDGNISIGALSTHAKIGHSPLVELIPILGDCANGIADAQVRARGTIGGSVSSADPSADWPTLLYTLDAEIVCSSSGGNRNVSIRDFIRDSYATVLGQGELVTEIRFKVPPANSGGSYIGYKKSAPAYPTASAGVQLTLADGDVCQQVRLALGASGPKPVTSEEAENLLRGKVLTPELIAQAAEAIVEVSDPPSDSRGTPGFKRAILHSLFIKAARRAMERAGGSKILGRHEYV